jgi:hypothetical protein
VTDTLSADPTTDSLFEAPVEPKPEGRRRGRPLGSRNKPKPEGDADQPKPRPIRRRGAGSIVKRRVPLNDLISDLVEGLAMIAATKGKGPMGRVLALESGALSTQAETTLNGTVVDRVLQPVARLGTAGKEILGLLGLPLATQAFVTSPNAKTQAAFKTMLGYALPALITDIKAKKRQQDKLESDLSDLAEEFGKPPGERVTLDDVAMWILGDMIYDVSAKVEESMA